MTQTAKRISYGAVMIALASSLWGLDGVVLTPRLTGLPVIYVVFVLHLLPFVLMNLFWFTKYRHLKTLDVRGWISLILVSVFGGAVGTIAIVKALFLVNFHQLSVVVLLQKFQPVFALILAALFLKEKLSRSFLFWASIAVIAGYFLTFGWRLPHFDTGDQTWKAALLSLFAAFSFGSSTVFSKSLLEEVDYTTGTFYRYGMTSLLLLPFVIIGGYLPVFSSVTQYQWMIILLIALTTGSGAILLYYYGLRFVKASTSTVMELMFPITAVLLDYFINGNVLSVIQWVSALVMVAAIYRISQKG
jgi:drug/metabolite transporter (DMT)-like permease